MTLIFANLTWKKYRIKRWCILQISRESQSLCEKKGIKRPPSLMRSFWDNERFELSSIFMMTMLRDLTNSHDSSSSSHFCFCSSSYSFFLSYSTPVLCAQVFFSLLTTIFIACEARLSSTTMSSIIPQAILVKSNYFKGGEGKGASLQFRNVHFWSHPLLANVHSYSHAIDY